MHASHRLSFRRIAGSVEGWMSEWGRFRIRRADSVAMDIGSDRCSFFVGSVEIPVDKTKQLEQAEAQHDEVRKQQEQACSHQHVDVAWSRGVKTKPNHG